MGSRRQPKPSVIFSLLPPSRSAPSCGAPQKAIATGGGDEKSRARFRVTKCANSPALSMPDLLRSLGFGSVLGSRHSSFFARVSARRLTLSRAYAASEHSPKITLVKTASDVPRVPAVGWFPCAPKVPRKMSGKGSSQRSGTSVTATATPIIGPRKSTITALLSRIAFSPLRSLSCPKPT